MQGLANKTKSKNNILGNTEPTNEHTLEINHQDITDDRHKERKTTITKQITNDMTK